MGVHAPARGAVNPTKERRSGLFYGLEPGAPAVAAPPGRELRRVDVRARMPALRSTARKRQYCPCPAGLPFFGPLFALPFPWARSTCC